MSLACPYIAVQKAIGHHSAGKTFCPTSDMQARRFGDRFSPSCSCWSWRSPAWLLKKINNDAVGYNLKYTEEALKVRLQAAGQSLSVKYLKYDRGLNGS